MLPIARVLLLAVLLVVTASVAAALPTAAPDLVPYAPPGYQYPVVPNSVKNTTTAGTTLYAGRDTYYDWYFTNAGDAAVAADFHVEVRIDGAPFIRYPYSAGFWAGAVSGFDDWSHVFNGTGSHTVTIVVDPDNVVAESDESNNVWQMAFQWSAVNGWWAEYFNNTSLSGDPVLVRSEFIDFEWDGSPGPGVNANSFSVRWTRDLDLQQPTQRFTLTRDNGMRFYFDNVLIYDEWTDTVDEDTFIVDTTVGVHTMRLEMYDNGGPAVAKLQRLPCFPLTLTVSPAGAGSINAAPPPNCGTKYVRTEVTLQAIPNTGYTFANWSGDLTGTQNPAIIETSLDAKEVTANFATTACYTLTTAVNPPGSGTVSANPSPNCAGGKYSAGTTVTVTAAANSGYTFVNWSGDVSGTQLNRTVTMNGNRSVTANFSAVCYNLTTAVNPPGSGTVSTSPPPNCAGGKYSAGTTVSLTATAAGDYAFANWSGNASGTQNITSVTMNGNRSVTANFTPICYSLAVGISPSGSGTVSADPLPNCAGGLFTAGTVVSLRATAFGNNTFANWSGDLTGTQNPKTVVMNANRVVTAHFIEAGTDCYPLARNHTGQGTDPTAAPAQSTGCAAGSYNPGTTVQLVAVPAAGWRVGGWTGTATDSATTTTNSVVTTDAGHAVTVNYVPIDAGDESAMLPFILFGRVGYLGPRETEPNNLLTEANGPIMFNRDYQGFPNDLSDYYYFDLMSTTAVDITLENITGQDPQLQLRDAGNNLVGPIDAQPPYLLSRLLTPGRYYVRVVVVAGNNSATLYTLRVNLP